MAATDAATWQVPLLAIWFVLWLALWFYVGLTWPVFKEDRDEHD